MLLFQVPENVLRPSEPLMANRAVPQTLVSVFGSQSFCKRSPVRVLGQDDDMWIVNESRGGRLRRRLSRRVGGRGDRLRSRLVDWWSRPRGREDDYVGGRNLGRDCWCLHTRGLGRLSWTGVRGTMAFIIDTLTSLGMTVSDAKTVILDGLRGPQKSRLLKPLLKQHPDRGPCLQLACSRGFLDLPFRHSHMYLGMKLSYGPFERLTLQLRLK